MKNCHKAAENAKIIAVLNTHKQLLVSDKNIRIRDRLKNFRTPHMIRSTLMLSFCKLELVWPSCSLFKITVSSLWNALFTLSFIMHYTEYCSMRHYARFRKSDPLLPAIWQNLQLESFVYICFLLSTRRKSNS